jgi:AraC family transcriptional activator of pobA
MELVARHKKLRQETVSKKNRNIPVNKMVMAGHSDIGIAIERMHIGASEEEALNSSDEAKQSHREDRHSFFLLEKGTVIVEIDFQQFEIERSSVVYMHPDQVHRILRIRNATIGVLAIIMKI